MNGHPNLTVTVTNEHGDVIFVGRPSQVQDTFQIVQKEGRPARLLCSVTDVTGFDPWVQDPKNDCS